MNIFIETLSLYSKERQEDIYRVADASMLPAGFDVSNVGFSGCQTNEAPTKYIIWSLAQRKEVLDRIYIINTKETIGQELQHIGTTTYVFYCESIIHYIEDLSKQNSFLQEYLQTHYFDYNRELYHSSAEAYFYDVTRSKVVSEKRLVAEWKELTDSIFEDERIDLYFDFTGGSRVSSLISMFTLRIAEIKEAKLKQVIYSDITTDPPKIVDCTSTYSILYEIEHVEKAQGTEKQVSIEHEVGQRLGWVTESEKKTTEIYDKALKESSTSIRKKGDDEMEYLEESAEKDMRRSSGFSKRSKSTSLEKTKKNNKQSPFLTFLSKVGTIHTLESLENVSTDNIERLIVRFYEEIIDAFCEIGLMNYHAKDLHIGKNRKETIAFVIRANSDYYFKTRIIKKTRKEIRSGVIPVVQRWIKELLNDLLLDPISVMNAHTLITDQGYSGRCDRNLYVVGVTKVLNDEFISYLKDQNIYMDDLPYKNLTSIELFERLSSLQRIYFNYGYPFRFVCQSKLLPNVEDYYRQSVNRLMLDLSQLRKTDSKRYSQRLKVLSRYNDTTPLENEIPILTECEEVWTVDCTKVSDVERNEFVKTLSARMEEVRPFRNAIAHQATPQENPYRERSRQNGIVKSIIEWLIEYDEKFSE